MNNILLKFIVEENSTFLNAIQKILLNNSREVLVVSGSKVKGTFSEGDIKTPFGGYKQSGSLSRDQGTEALNQYLQTKTIWISHS